jgi:hypothetical protein
VDPDVQAVGCLLEIDFKAESTLSAGGALTRAGAMGALGGVFPNVPCMNNFRSSTMWNEVNRKKDIHISLNLGV